MESYSLGQIDLGGINPKGEDVILIDYPLDLTNVPAWMVGHMSNESWAHFTDKINQAYKDSSIYWFRQAPIVCNFSLPLFLPCPILGLLVFFTSVLLYCAGQLSFRTRLNKIDRRLKKVCLEQTLLCQGLEFYSVREWGKTNNGFRSKQCWLYHIHVRCEVDTYCDENKSVDCHDDRIVNVFIGEGHTFDGREFSLPRRIQSRMSDEAWALFCFQIKEACKSDILLWRKRRDQCCRVMLFATILLPIIQAPLFMSFACLFIIIIINESHSRYIEVVGHDVRLKLGKLCEEQTALYLGLAFRATIDVKPQRFIGLVFQVKLYFIEIVRFDVRT